MLLKAEDRSDSYLNGTTSEDRRTETTDRYFWTFLGAGEGTRTLMDCSASS